jgi:hypothetical protein
LGEELESEAQEGTVGLFRADTCVFLEPLVDRQLVDALVYMSVS